MKAMKPSSKLFAFWRCDLYPYLLGAKVVYMREDGKISSEDFHKGWVKPLLLLPLAEGKRLQKELETMKEKRRVEMKIITDAWDSKVDQLFAGYPFFVRVSR